MELFYNEVKEKKKKQTDEVTSQKRFSASKIHDLNDQNNVEMFSTSTRGGISVCGRVKN